MTRRLFVVLFGALALMACRESGSPAPVFGEPVRVNDLDGGAGQSEPSIAAADDGRTLVAGWVDWSEQVPYVRLARSTDGAATFASSRRIVERDPAHGHGQAEATVAWTSGRFAFGWIGCRADADSLENHACDVYLATSSDGGLSWSPPHPIAEGGAPRRDRPWVVAEGSRFAIAWSEVSTDGSRWKLAREQEDGRFETVATLDGRAAVQPPAPTSAGLEALLLDRVTRDPRQRTLERRRVDGDEPAPDRWTFAPEAALLPYSLGAFAARPDGESWVAIPRGTGTDDDLALQHRAAGSRAFRSAHTLRTPGSVRVGLPWIAPLRSSPRFLAAWIDEHPDAGWRVRARLLGPGTAASHPADVSRSAFTFVEASRTRNIGDFLAVASAKDACWIAWSDTRDGDADIWIARGDVR